MRFFLMCSLVLWIFNITFLHNKTAETSQILHQLCLKRLPSMTEHTDLVASLVCGKAFPDSPDKSLLINSSLIHLIVVSGAHFLVLEKLLTLLKLSRMSQFLILGLYWVMTLCQPPGLMALLLWLLGTSSVISWPYRFQKVLAAGVLAFIINPALVFSASLYLSWLCCSTLSLFHKKTNPLVGAISIYLSLSWIGGWTPWAHPLGIFLNLTLGALLSLFLFPIALFSSMTHYGVHFLEFLLNLFFKVLLLFNLKMGPQEWVWSPTYWLYILGLHLGLHFFFKIKARSQI